MAAAPSSSRPRAPQPIERLLVVLVAVGLWSILPPYVGPLLGLDLDVSSTVEAVDHLIPGVLAACAAFATLLLTRRGRADGLPAFAGLAICALAGLFQTVSHVTLVAHAGGPLRPPGSVALHASPGPVLLALSLWLLLRPPRSR